MQHFIALFIALFLMPVVTACGPSAGAIDKKLAKACEESVKIFLAETDRLEVKKSSFSSDKGFNNLPLRIVKLDTHLAHENEAPQEKTYTCSYSQQLTMLDKGVEFYSMEMGGSRYGNFDGHIEGEMTDLLKIAEVTRKNIH